MPSNYSGIKITIIGSGTCVPSLKRSSCSVLMETGGSKLLFDSGPGTMRRLLEADTEIIDLSYLFYSHFHPDHTGELATILFAMKYSKWNRTKKYLKIIAGKGFNTFFQNLKSVYGDWIEIGSDTMDIVELDNQSFDLLEPGNFKVDFAPVEHNQESIAYKITSSGGQSAVYSGDTDYSENLITLAKDVDVFICESAFPDDLKVKGHLTPSEAGKIAALAGVHKLVLTHFYPECDKADIEKECRKTYSGPLVLAEDLMKFEID
ncbi:MAG: MBL fold metallo-hydrolase [Deltaproteobacteria bacterium]|nr:MBL fold metallo-hydrolase [Deltaproteobacteria bacterium]MBW1847097.1 MBL fold metallo-hydrolase [Deltaproteobacteria bacterium]MBW1984818.1 MBL fold metallo-hydrolase [Deltaproteobacteria bacterium]MBW2179082.1 MBL fold metallo-hydrolase [Deltaproteobacteria bacterium]MBW2366142.1 MBL fold metallo-hydrolase [Deltaproteobacteria bacterium]